MLERSGEGVLIKLDEVSDTKFSSNCSHRIFARNEPEVRQHAHSASLFSR